MSEDTAELAISVDASQAPVTTMNWQALIYNFFFIGLARHKLVVIIIISVACLLSLFYFPYFFAKDALVQQQILTAWGGFFERTNLVSWLGWIVAFVFLIVWQFATKTLKTELERVIIEKSKLQKKLGAQPRSSGPDDAGL